jgi:cytochrome P450
MANQSVTTASAPRARVPATARANAQAEPVLLAQIQNAGAPVVSPKAAAPPRSLPGTTNPFRCTWLLLDLFRRGIASSLEARERWGDIYRVSLAGVPSVVVWDADEIARIFKNEDHVWSTAMGWNAAMLSGVDPRGGNAGTLGALDFDEHRAARKLVQPAFTMNAIDGYLATADGAFSKAATTWSARSHVDFKSEVRTLLAQVATEIFTGIREPAVVDLVDRALSDFWHAVVALRKDPRLSPTFRRAQKGFSTLLQQFIALVPERRRSGGNDLFSRMCSIDDMEGLDDEAIVRVFITIMFGAFDTTAAGMATMAYLLAKHPEWQERLRQEALAAPSGPLDVAAMKGMKQHEWVWKESLRLFPIAMYVPRCNLRKVTLCGYELEAGTMVVPMSGGVGRHPKWWTDVDAFDPERFAPERAEDRRHPGIYNPFGAGAHACVGMQLANMEMKAFWHRMLRTCRFELAPDYEARHAFMPLGIVSGKVRLAIQSVA